MAWLESIVVLNIFLKKRDSGLSSEFLRVFYAMENISMAFIPK